jgi:flagellar motor switch protein FliM
MTVAVFDFRHPPLSPAERQAREWLEAASRRSARSTAGVEWQLHSAGKSFIRDAFAGLPDSAQGFALEINSQPSCLVIPRPVLLWMLTRALGEQLPELPPDREITTVERDSLSYLIPQFFEPMRAVWPTSTPPQIRLIEYGNPKAICRLPLDQPNVVAFLRPIVGGDAAKIILAFPMNLLSQPSAALPKIPPFDRSELEFVVKHLPIDFTVLLGSAVLDVARLSQLKTGDVIVLDQRVNTPLVAQIGGVPRFHVWPGAIGRDLGVRIVDKQTSAAG